MLNSISISIHECVYSRTISGLEIKYLSILVIFDEDAILHNTSKGLNSAL